MTAAELEPVVTQYTVCALPEGHMDYSLFSMTVDRVLGYEGVSGWAVRRMGRCLDRKGRWDHEPQPSSRTNGWIKQNRHDLAKALDLAKAAAPLVKINGLSVEHVLTRGRDHG